jgi:hypothetical protein
MISVLILYFQKLMHFIRQLFYIFIMRKSIFTKLFRILYSFSLMQSLNNRVFFESQII